MTRTRSISTMILASLLLGYAVKAATTTQTQTAPAVVTPLQIAKTFVMGLEEFLVLEHKNPAKAKDVIRKIAPIIADHTIAANLAPYGLKISDLPDEKIFEIRSALIGSWAAVINFYQGYMNYAQINQRSPLTPSATLGNLVRVMIPAERQGYPHPVNIMVACVMEKDQWKVRFVAILPKKTK